MEKNSDFQGIFGAGPAGEETVNTGEELEMELTRLRKKDRRNMFIIGTLSALMIAAGTIMYMTREADPAPSYNSGFTSGGTAASYAVSSGYGSQGYNSGAGSSSGASGLPAGGGCCGGGAGGSALGDVSLSDLEKKASEQYTKETGKSDIRAKANNFGCHIQIDIYDAQGNVVRSYGYRGGPLYVIQ